jgi:hypothetical protein
MLPSEWIRDCFYCPNYDCKVHIISKKEASRGEQGDANERLESSAPKRKGFILRPRNPESLTSGEQIEQYVRETVKEVLEKKKEISK